MLFREEESLFRFSADRTQKKKKCPQLCILEIPMTFASQPAKQSMCSINRLPLLQLAGRKLTKTLCFLSRAKLLCAPSSHLVLQHHPHCLPLFLEIAHQHEEGKRQRNQGCVKLVGVLVSLQGLATWCWLLLHRASRSCLFLTLALIGASSCFSWMGLEQLCSILTYCANQREAQWRFALLGEGAAECSASFLSPKIAGEMCWHHRWCRSLGPLDLLPAVTRRS